MSVYMDPLYLWIGGRRVLAGERESEAVINPATEEVIGRLPRATGSDLDFALESAQTGFDAWRLVSGYDRARVLKRIADGIRDELEHIATCLTLDQGKPLAEARVDVATAADLFEFYGEEARRIYGRIIPSRVQGTRQYVVRQPVGPVAAFCAWNFPAVNVARKIAPALAAGCSVIIKPSEETPSTGLLIAQIAHEAGVPAGALNVVHGVPSFISTTLIASETIRKISFTGSTVIGKQLAHLAADGMKRMTLELGGHAPVLVFDDADLDRVAELATLAKLRNAGQICNSPTRFYVQERAHEKFVSLISARMDGIVVGDGMEAGSVIGPLVAARRVDMMRGLVEDATKGGARIAAGGNSGGSTKGYFWRPTVLSDVPESARMMAEEPFGPIMSVNRFATEEEAVSMANRLPYGLAAFVATGDHARAMRVAEELQCGMVGINNFVVSYPETPAGGVKESGFGSEGGPEGLEAYLQPKYISVC